MTSPSPAPRTEHDLIGSRMLPAVLYGIHTLRAVENFPISGQRLVDAPDLIRALAAIKWAAARTNAELGLLPQDKAEAIGQACADLIGGAFHDQFVVDLIQGGAGTSSNMNANEVIANLALARLGRAAGDYAHLHPNEDVNMGQSTNDVYPTALRLALLDAADRLLDAMAGLEAAFADKATEFADVIKMGRTQLQDAVPMTLGQEFATFARMVGADRAALAAALPPLHQINLGGTAIGTGLTTHPLYAPKVCAALRAITKRPLETAPDLITATQDVGDFVQLSGALKRIATKLSKICNDLRLLSSGPRAGLNDIDLPAMQAGSSIMPGKVNPVIPEVVNQIAFEVIGNDVTITMAAEAGQLQLNAFEPVIFYSLRRSLDHLAAGCATLTQNCVRGITANRARLADSVHRSIGLVTALNPVIGYELATEVAKEALAEDRSVVDIVTARALVAPDKLAELLRPEMLTNCAKAG